MFRHLAKPIPKPDTSTSRTVNFLDAIQVRVLRDLPIDPALVKDRHWPHGRKKTKFVPGDMLWLVHRGRLSLMPFERAGGGFEILKDPREGVDFEYV